MTEETAVDHNGENVRVLIGVPKWLVVIFTSLAVTVIASAGGAVYFNSRDSAVMRAVFDVKTTAINKTIEGQSKSIEKLSDAITAMGLQINTLEVKFDDRN